MYRELLCEISVCTDCMLIHANGESDPDRPDGEPEPWALLGFGYDVSMGGDHNDSCTEAERQDGCDCEQLGFRTTSCDGCGSTLHGDRFLFTMWRVPVERARVEYRRAIETARDTRLFGFGDPVVRRVLADASAWRIYLLRIAAEERRSRMWFARMRAGRQAVAVAA